MGERILTGLVKDVLKNLGSRAFDEIVLAWYLKDRLESLKNTVTTIEDVLLDAEERQANDLLVRHWIERLAAAVYTADDLFDKVATLASQKQLMGGNKVIKEVHTFFSCSNQLFYVCSVSQKIKNIREELDGIVSDGNSFKFISRPIEGRSVVRVETMSYVDTERIIGRDVDKKNVLDMLLSSSPVDGDHGVLPAVIPIVGIGGIGKTALAQLLFNDRQIGWFDLRLWVCVPDKFDRKVIIEMILMSATSKEVPKLKVEQLQGMLRNEIDDKKYLIVLDDVWNIEREEWIKVTDLLKIGRKGSTILVTTRSWEVGKNMGTVPPYELQGLSDEKSWELFEEVAFGPRKAQEKPQLVEIGKEILQKCANVPLAIRAMGSALYGKGDSQWSSFKDKSLANMPDNPSLANTQSHIMDTLKLSYHHLWSALKNCFAYCALFPKDYQYNKEMLKDLWIAEGFIIIPTDNNESDPDEVAEHYFLTLQRRGFFQDIKRNSWGDIEGCKMHDLMHDLAEQVAGVQCQVAQLGQRDFNDKLLHLSFGYQLTSSWKIPKSMKKLKLLRTFLLPDQIEDGSFFSNSVCQQLLTRFSRLRVLDMNNLRLKSLPHSIEKLLHLRYIDLSNNPIEILPDSITKLWNLQTLILYGCVMLRELPINMRKLTNLRSLNVLLCQRLTYMPSGMDQLTLLNKLPQFIVGHAPSAGKLRHNPSSAAKLGDLTSLKHLRGVLEIVIHNNIENTTSGELLSCKHRLTDLKVSFSQDWKSQVDNSFNHDGKAVLQVLKPHSSLKMLYIEGYIWQDFPSWAKMDDLCLTLPNLVEITLGDCGSFQLPIFSRLRWLKYLDLFVIESVKYMEDSEHDISSSITSSKAPMSETIFFPSLEVLMLDGLTNLKGWWEEVEADVADKGTKGTLTHDSTRQFSKLWKLMIHQCSNLKVLPLCPNVEDLTLLDSNESLSVLEMATTTKTATPSSSSASSSSHAYGWKLKRLTIDNAEYLTSLPNHCLHELCVRDRKLESISDGVGAVFATSSSSLRSLVFRSCANLTSISKGLEHLTGLEKLVLQQCAKLELTRKEDEDEMPWEAMKNNLRSLTLYGLPKLVSLPRGLQRLTNLRSLALSCNEELTVIPEWIDCFSSLKYLELRECPKLNHLPDIFRDLNSLNELRIVKCPGLTEGCRQPNGSQWSKIQHIPFVSVLDTFGGR